MKLHLVFATLLVFALAGSASAQSLSTDAAGAVTDSRPARGMTEARVEAKFGSPVSKVAAVGEPPISRWEYPGFIVYFEYDRVIHAVSKR
ncbi:MAG: hypothetical protein AAFX56_02440 [Pseudomonadota bacterium]